MSDPATEPVGRIRNSAMRYTLIIGVVGSAGFVVLLVFVIAINSPVWEIVASLAFVAMGVVALLQGLTSAVEFDSAGVRARPLPWRRIQLPWSEVAWFEAGSKGLYAVTQDDQHRLLLEFGHLTRQWEECRAANETLNHALGAYSV